MNQQILEFAKQAGLKSFFEEDLSPQEKVFVQLIVKQCVFISRTNTNGFSAGRKMEEYFGVK